MLNNKDKEKVFDSILSCAFEQAMKEEIDEMPDNSELAKQYQPTDRLRRDVDKIMKKKKPKQTHPAWRRVAIAAMVVICVSLGSAVASPQIRAGVKEAVVELFDKYTSINFGNVNTSIDLGNGYTMNYLPEGYELINIDSNTVMNAYTFVNETNSKMVLSITYSDFSETKIDNENIILKEFSINEYSAYLMSVNNGKYSIIWGNSNITFFLNANLTEENLISIAENIKKNKIQ